MTQAIIIDETPAPPLVIGFLLVVSLLSHGTRSRLYIREARPFTPAQWCLGVFFRVLLSKCRFERLKGVGVYKHT